MSPAGPAAGRDLQTSGARPMVPGMASVRFGDDVRDETGGRGATLAARAGGVLVGLLVGVALVVAQLLRLTGTRTWQAFAAEDGAVYYQDLLDDGALTPLLRSFAGYAQLPTRLLTIPAGWVPLASVPAYFAIVGSVVTALLAGCAYRWARGWIPSRPLRVAVVALVVISPVAADEMAANLVNTIWVLVAVLPWALVARQEGRGDTVGRAVVAFLAATATGVAFAFVPLAVGWAWARRTRSALVVGGAYAVGLVVQGVAMLAATDAQPDVVERPLGTMAEIVALRSAASPLLGHEAARSLWEDHGTAVLGGGVLVLVAVFALAAAGARRAEQALAGCFVVTAVGTVAALVWSRGTTAFEFLGGSDVIFPFGHPRYSYLASVLLTSALAVLLSGRDDLGSGGVVLGRAALVTQVAVLVAASYTLTGYRSLSPPWSEGLERAAATCRAEGRAPDDPVEIVQDAEGLRVVRVPCADVLEAVEG